MLTVGLLFAGLLSTSCDNGNNDEGKNSSGKTIIITGLSGNVTIGGAALYSYDKTSKQLIPVAGSSGPVTGSSMTTTLKDSNSGNWNGSGSYYLGLTLIENSSGKPYWYTNGQEFNQLGVITNSLETMQYLPKYDINKVETTIPLSKFREVK